MNTAALEQVKKTKMLHDFKGIYLIAELVIDHVKKEYPEHGKLNRSIDLVKEICELIENLCHDNNVKGEKGFKLDIAKKVYGGIGLGRADDIEFVVNSINYLHANGSIKKVKLSKKLKKFVYNFFLKRLLE